MKSVIIEKVQYATNNDGRGLFRLEGGAYVQLEGNGQTPIFKTLPQFRRYLSRHYSVTGRTEYTNWRLNP